MLNRKQFSREFAERYGITYQNAENIVRNLFEFLGTKLYEEGEDVSIHGFGSFKHKTIKSRNIRHPGTGKIVTQPERDIVKFTPSELLSGKDE